MTQGTQERCAQTKSVVPRTTKHGGIPDEFHVIVGVSLQRCFTRLWDGRWFTNHAPESFADITLLRSLHKRDKYLRDNRSDGTVAVTRLYDHAVKCARGVWPVTKHGGVPDEFEGPGKTKIRKPVLAHGEPDNTLTTEKRPGGPHRGRHGEQDELHSTTRTSPQGFFQDSCAPECGRWETTAGNGEKD